MPNQLFVQGSPPTTYAKPPQNAKKAPKHSCPTPQEQCYGAFYVLSYVRRRPLWWVLYQPIIDLRVDTGNAMTPDYGHVCSDTSVQQWTT